jgi:outer membrane protein assembly factor BamD
MAQKSITKIHQMNKFYTLSLLFLLLISCSPYQKALKSEDMGVKYTAAEEKYNNGKYNKAIRLFEQMATSYRGKPQAEKMFYMYAQSYYKTKQYYLAGYQFESFASSYPKSEKLEECAYLGAFCYSKLSPIYSLDQTDTNKAIDKMQAFIDNYPESSYMSDANVIVKELREKVEKKAFEIAKQYNTIYDYKSALIALDNFITDYPGTPYRDAALYYKIDSAYHLAINSVPEKVKERLLNAKEAYEKFSRMSNTKEYTEKADDLMTKINENLQQYSK